MAKIVEIVDGPNGPTLGGDVDKMIALVAKHCHVSKSVAKEMLSSACEQLELACDEIDEMRKITMGEILYQCGQIAAEEGEYK